MKRSNRMGGAELKVKVKHRHNQHHQLVTYNHTLARILVQYASAGFVGVATDLNATVIAFRGTQESSIQNWVEDLYWKQLDIDYPGVDGAMVHHGFYTAYHNTSLRPGVLNAVQKAKEIYGNIKIIVTGHSMGGAMAAFCGLDLRLSLGEKNVQVMTFGQPRIGNAAFASYFNQIVPDTIRVTNDHDIVPHLPPYYYYFPQKTSVSGNSISDHLAYFGVQMGCDESSSCRMVMDPRVAAYGRTDLDGNLIISRDPSTPILKLDTDRGDKGSSV
ncbi:hypothetical protein DH2020_035795 [Rehmannia glutinosa]|uniref:Fungal lipase-type domain-containing protein n=1 Tax=Rehmannia glutinosa TaxID=99300 RepID=A0ABR0V5G3_REHGL